MRNPEKIVDVIPPEEASITHEYALAENDFLMVGWEHPPFDFSSAGRIAVRSNMDLFEAVEEIPVLPSGHEDPDSKRVRIARAELARMLRRDTWWLDVRQNLESRGFDAEQLVNPPMQAYEFADWETGRQPFMVYNFTEFPFELQQERRIAKFLSGLVVNLGSELQSMYRRCIVMPVHDPKKYVLSELSSHAFVYNQHWLDARPPSPYSEQTFVDVQAGHFTNWIRRAGGCEPLDEVQTVVGRSGELRRVHGATDLTLDLPSAIVV